MAEALLTPRSALAGRAFLVKSAPLTSEPGVTVEELEPAGIAGLAARPGALPDLVEAARALRLELPEQPRFCEGVGRRAVWFGPERWLVFGEPDLEQALRDSLGEWASITDQSDARVLLRVSGPRAADALAKGVSIDLHPRAFGPGDVALTQAAHVPLAVWQEDAAPSYVLAVQRSYAVSVMGWLVEAAAEYRFALV